MGKNFECNEITDTLYHYQREYPSFGGFVITT